MRAKVWDGIREVFDNGLSSQEIKNKYNQIYTTYKKELTNSEGLEQVNVCGNIGIFLMPYFRESPRKEWRIVLLMSWAVDVGLRQTKAPTGSTIDFLSAYLYHISWETAEIIA